MSVEKPEELQTTPAPQAAALTDAERAELEALRAEKERRELEALRAEKERAELEALRAEKTRAVQAEAQAQAEAAAAEDAQLVADRLQQRQPLLKTLSLLQISSVPHVKQLSRKPSRCAAFKSSAQRVAL